MYSTCTRVHARIPNGHPREVKRASDKSPQTSRRAEWAAHAEAGRLPRRARGSSCGSWRGSSCRFRCPWNLTLTTHWSQWASVNGDMLPTLTTSTVGPLPIYRN